MRNFTRRITFLSSALLALVLAGPLQAEKYLGKAVIVHFQEKGRTPVTGTVIDEVEGVKILVRLQLGQRWIETSQISRIEIKKPPAEEFKDRFKECQAAGKADRWVELARWCGLPEVKLPDERKRCLEEAVKLDPQHKGARSELGQVKDEKGNWVDEEEHYGKKGLVRMPDGTWGTPEAAERKKAEMSGKAKGITAREKEDTGVPWAVARTLKNPRYILKCNSTETAAARYLQVLDKLHEKYTEIFKDYQPLYTGPATVYVFRNREEFRTFTLSQLGVGGFFSLLDRAVRAYHGSFGETGNTDLVLAHEATHQFQHRIMREMTYAPVWLIEGMAVYFGDGTKIKQEGKSVSVQVNVIPRMRLISLQNAISSGRYLKLEGLLRLPRSSGPMYAYDHGWGVIFWCLQGDNSKYKFGHKGEGKRVWKQYLDHLIKDVQKPIKSTHLDDEAKFFLELITKESGKTIPVWEEEYKKFIMNLPVESLGKWSGRRWDGMSGPSPVGVRFSVPEGLSPVLKEQDLRVLSGEAAAATTTEGVRLWLRLDDNLEGRAEDALRNFVRSNFTDIQYEEEYEEEEMQEVSVGPHSKVLRTALRGKYARRRESSLAGAEPKGADGGKGKGGKGAKKEKEKAAPAKAARDPSTQVRAEVALFSTFDRLYVFCLDGPEAPFSKVETKFDEVLKSVELNYGLR